MRFSATDAAFEGFRIVRRNPLVLLAWTVLYLVVGAATLFAMSTMLPALTDLSQIAEAFKTTEPESFDDFAPVMNAYGRVMGGMSWVMVLSWVVNVMLMAAVARGVLADKTVDAFGHVRLGMDEVRVFVVSVVLWILMVLISIVVMVIAAVVSGIAAAAVEDWGWVVSLVLMLGAAAFLIWLAVRWSLAIPITVAEKKFAFFDSFRVTRGQFWPLLGMTLLACVMAVLVALLSMLVSMPLSLMSGAEMIGKANDDPAVLMAAFRIDNPWMWASTAVNAVISALILGVVYAPFAAAYRALSGRGAAADA